MARGWLKDESEISRASPRAPWVGNDAARGTRGRAGWREAARGRVGGRCESVLQTLLAAGRGTGIREVGLRSALLYVVLFLAIFFFSLPNRELGLWILRDGLV